MNEIILFVVIYLAIFVTLSLIEINVKLNVLLEDEDEDSSVYEATAEQFAKWVATEIFDDNWKYNKDAFDELACRKLAKLGIVRANGDEWELVESEESEEV